MEPMEIMLFPLVMEQTRLFETPVQQEEKGLELSLVDLQLSLQVTRMPTAISIFRCFITM